MTLSQERRRVSRVRPSGLVSNTATIILDPKKPGVACSVVDISAAGASLQVAYPEKLPKRFWLMHGKTKKSCLVIWRRHHRIGVQF
ncbi:MAG TPA: PilZ domain-containing protein [Xanthobacteraceae bacterium]|nr:PilZ domain-containing protein [Xanthobacteraceae bacterium]